MWPIQADQEMPIVCVYSVINHEWYWFFLVPLKQPCQCKIMFYCNYQLGQMSSYYPSKWHCDDSCYSRTNDSALHNHLCSFIVCTLPSSRFTASLFYLFSSGFPLTTSLFSNLSNNYSTYACFFFSGLFCFFPLSFTYSSFPPPLVRRKNASQSLVGRTVRTVHGNLSVMKTCNSQARSSALNPILCSPLFSVVLEYLYELKKNPF